MILYIRLDYIIHSSLLAFMVKYHKGTALSLCCIVVTWNFNVEVPMIQYYSSTQCHWLGNGSLAGKIEYIFSLTSSDFTTNHRDNKAEHNWEHLAWQTHIKVKDFGCQRANDFCPGRKTNPLLCSSFVLSAGFDAFIYISHGGPIQYGFKFLGTEIR